MAGWVRWNDEVQLRAVPPGAPLPDDLSGPWPCLLEYEALKSVDPFVWAVRAERAGWRLMAQLSVFLRTRVGDGHSSNAFWARPFGPQDSSSVMRHEGYWHDSLSDCPVFERLPNEQAIATSPASDYFGGWLLDAGDRRAPDSLGRLLSAARALRGSQAERFNRACWWHWQAMEQWSRCPTLAYQSLVNAIETMARELDDHRPTRRFRAFLARWLGDNPEAKEVGRALYELRCDIVHEGRFFSDERPSVMLLEQRSVVEESSLRWLTWAVEAAIVRWLEGTSGARP